MIKQIRIAAALYAAIAIATFGHAASKSEKAVNADYAECLRNPPKTGICWRDDSRPVGVGSFAAVFWPLYWSWVAWQ
ncbi:MAG: hypothetical protein EBR82_17125 [Caulobacteraceae bacterium]|nr:hypothetical protein [Caulobacteraceae bacterium]